MDRLTPEQRRRNMQAIRSTNTKVEIMLGKAMWAKGIRYRKNNKKVFGKPDFTIKKSMVAIFCDSEFWHGKDWDILQQRLMTNRTFWLNKLERNRARDILVNKTLTEQGWKILRFWEQTIKSDLQRCISLIQSAIEEQAP